MQVNKKNPYADWPPAGYHPWYRFVISGRLLPPAHGYFTGTNILLIPVKKNVCGYFRDCFKDWNIHHARFLYSEILPAGRKKTCAARRLLRSWYNNPHEVKDSAPKQWKSGSPQFHMSKWHDIPCISNKPPSPGATTMRCCADSHQVVVSLPLQEGKGITLNTTTKNYHKKLSNHSYIRDFNRARKNLKWKCLRHFHPVCQ